MNSIVYVCVLCLAVQIFGHSYMSQPASLTNQAQSQSGCRVDNPATYGAGAPSCPGPCDDSGGAHVTQTTPYPTSRGAVLDIRWARNNHPGGFVRFAWAPTGSTTNAQFDSYAYRFECFEKGPNCIPSGPGQTGDASTDTQTGCGTNITVPAYLTDGAWTLQWAWFGGYNQLGDYYSCANYQVSGGETLNANDITYGSPTYHVFAGGDVANPNAQSCQFRNTDRLHQCVEEDCNAPLYTIGVQQTGIPVNSDGTTVTKVAAIYPTNVAPPPQSSSGGVTGSGDSSSQQTPVPCTANTQCSSGICGIDGFCVPASKSSSKAATIAALVFAFVFLLIVLTAVLFIFVNKSEWKRWKPFNK
jgi:hypothetical protein